MKACMVGNSSSCDDVWNVMVMNCGGYNVVYLKPVAKCGRFCIGLQQNRNACLLVIFHRNEIKSYNNERISISEDQVQQKSFQAKQCLYPVQHTNICNKSPRNGIDNLMAFNEFQLSRARLLPFIINKFQRSNHLCYSLNETK